MSIMCTLYYRQLQVDNQELSEKLDLLETAEAPSQALQREVVRLREDKRELQLRVRQLEAENQASMFEMSRRPKADPELPVGRPSDRLGYETSFQKSPQKRRQHSSRREEARSAAGTSKREAIEALSQMLLNRAAYSKR